MKNTEATPKPATGTGTEFAWVACSDDKCSRKHLVLSGERMHRVKVAA